MGLLISRAFNAPRPQVLTSEWTDTRGKRDMCKKCKTNRSFLPYKFFTSSPSPLSTPNYFVFPPTVPRPPKQRAVSQPIPHPAMAFIPATSFTGLRVRAATPRVCHAPARVAKWQMSEGGKGFGGGEATREYVVALDTP